LLILAEIEKYSAIFAVFNANAPNFRELGRSSALAERTRKVDSNDRALLNFDMMLAHFLRMLIEKYFLY
jgi:hypothetical protein